MELISRLVDFFGREETRSGLAGRLRDDFLRAACLRRTNAWSLDALLFLAQTDLGRECLFTTVPRAPFTVQGILAFCLEPTLRQWVFVVEHFFMGAMCGVWCYCIV